MWLMIYQWFSLLPLLDAESRQAELDTENGGEVTPVEDSADEYEDWFVPYQDDGVDDGQSVTRIGWMIGWCLWRIWMF